MTETRQYDILIVGLGPVGAVLAALCAQLGLGVRTLERDTEIYKLPRAVHIDYEVARLLNFIGVADDLLANSCFSTGYEFINRDGEILMSRYPPSRHGPTGYPWNNMFHQPSLERALRHRLDELENAEITLGATVTGITQDEGEVSAVFESGQQTERIRARFAVGCDGGRSFVRKSLGIAMADLGFDEPWLVVDVKLPPGMRQLRKASTQLCDPAHPTTSAVSGPGRHRWEFMLRPGEDHAGAMAPAGIRSRIASWTDRVDEIEIERSAIYEFHGLIANRWHDGRILLIGDAAHQMPPFLGQGLCSGIRDAFNLAWKLALVLRNEVAPEFLDTVQLERGPHVAAITKDAITLGKIVCIADEAHAAERDRRMLADRAAGRAPSFPSMPIITHGVLADGGKTMPEPMLAGSENRRLDDACGYVPLLVFADGNVAGPHHQAQLPNFAFACLKNPRDGQFLVADEAGYLRRMLGEEQALLVKPDRIVFGAGDIDRLIQKWRAYLSGEASL